MNETKETEPCRKRPLPEHDQQPVKKKRDSKCEKAAQSIDEVFINNIANKIGNESRGIGIHLGYPSEKLEHLEQIYPKECVWRNHVMLVKWWEVAQQFLEEENIRKLLAKCIHSAGNRSLAESISNDYESIEKEKEIDDRIPHVVFDINGRTGVKEAQRGSTLKAWREKDKLFSETRAYHESKQSLDKKGYVTVVGPPGDGKTSIIIHLAFQMERNGFDVIPIKNFTEMHQYCDPREKRLLVFDDILGPTFIEMLEVEKFLKESKSIKDCITHGKIKFVATLRMSIFQQCKPQLERTLIGESIVDISSTNLQLNDEERKNILDRYSQNIPEETIRKLEVSHYFPGFPLLCHLFQTDNSMSTYNVASAFSPRIVLHQQIKEMEKHNQLSYCVLVLTAMMDGVFDPEDLDDIIDTNPPNTELVQTLKDWIGTCGLEIKSNVVRQLKQSFDYHKNIYLTEEGGTFAFYHDYIFDAVACHHGQGNIKKVLKHCSTCFIRDRVRTETADEDIEIICIPKNKYHLLAKRLEIDMKNGHIYNVFSNPVVKNKNFQKVFLEILSKNEISVLEKILTTIPKESERCDIKISLDAAVFESTPVHWLCRLGCLDLLKQLLIQIKVPPEEFFASLPGHTQPLHFAAGYGHLDVVKYILDQKVDVNAKSSLTKVDPSVGEFYTGFTPLFYAARQNFTEVVECLLQNGAEPNIVRDHGASPMLLAADRGHFKVIKLLLQYGADPNICCEHGTSPLFLAAQMDHTDAVVTLIDGKANINHQKPSNGMSPLSIAAQKGNVRTVECLLKYEANPDLRDKEGNTALHQTILNGFVETARILLKSNADTTIVNSNGKTVFELAKELKADEMINLFTFN